MTFHHRKVNSGIRISSCCFACGLFNQFDFQASWFEVVPECLPIREDIRCPRCESIVTSLWVPADDLPAKVFSSRVTFEQRKPNERG